MSTTIRRATPADANEILALFAAFASEESARDERHAFSDDAALRYGNDLRGWLTSDAHAIFVAEADGGIVGFQTTMLWYPPPLYRAGKEAFLSEVYVHPEARRQGVATALIRAAQAWAQAQGAVRLRCTLLDANAASRSLWEALGATVLLHTFTLELSPPDAPEKPRHPLGFST